MTERTVRREVNVMSEEKLASVLRDFIEAYVKGDVEKMLPFLAEDVVWIQPEGSFKGKEEGKRFLARDAAKRTNLRSRDAGIGIMVKGNKALYEHIHEGSTPDGRRWREIPAISVFEFSGGKIQQRRAYYDRLSMTEQMAKGWFERMIVSLIVNRWEKGLR